MVIEATAMSPLASAFHSLLQGTREPTYVCVQAPIRHRPSCNVLFQVRYPLLLVWPLGPGFLALRAACHTVHLQHSGHIKPRSLGSHLLCESTRTTGVCHLYIHWPLNRFCLFLLEGLGEGEPHRVGGREGCYLFPCHWPFAACFTRRVWSVFA